MVLPQAGGTWAAAWGEDGDEPDYVSSAVLSVFESPRRLVMSEQRHRAKEGPLPFPADFVTTFTVEPCERGTRLRVEQDGFPPGPEADDFLAACEQGWRETFAGIRRLLREESGDSGS